MQEPNRFVGSLGIPNVEKHPYMSDKITTKKLMCA